MNNFVKLDDGSYAEVGSIGYVSGQVVDESKDFGIPVHLVTPPVTPPVTPITIPWTYIAIAIGGVVLVIGLVLAIRRR